jgi:DNA-binding NarL/FixJ family response regulator
MRSLSTHRPAQRPAEPVTGRIDGAILASETIVAVLPPSGHKHIGLPLPEERGEGHVFDKLTDREIEVLKLIACGDGDREVAAKLGISFRTARTHRSHVMEKLDAHESSALVRYAIRTGLIIA